MKKTYSLGQRLVAQMLLGGLLLQSCFNPSVPISPLQDNKDQETSVERTSQALLSRLQANLNLAADVESNVLPINKQDTRPNSAVSFKNDERTSTSMHEPALIHSKKQIKTGANPLIHQLAVKNDSKIRQGTSTAHLSSPQNKPIKQSSKKLDILPTNQPFQENIPQKNHEQLAALPDNPSHITPEETPFYLAQGGYQVKFIKKGQGWVALVQDIFLNGLQRSFYLPVYEQNISIQHLSKHTPLWIKHHVHVCPPEKDKKSRKGYVYIGSQGLLGGGLAMAQKINMGEHVPKEPIHIAAKTGDVEKIKMLTFSIFGSSSKINSIVNTADPNLNTPLHYAAYNCQPEAFELLLSKGAKINLQDNLGKTALHYAFRFKLSMIEALLQAGANPNIQDNKGFTPFHQAARSNILSLVQLFLQKGVKQEISDKEGNRPLHSTYSKEIVALLITYGADKEAKNNAGKTPLFTAVQDKNLEKIKLLIEKGAKKEARDDSDNTVLHQVIADFVKEAEKIKGYFDGKEESLQQALQDAIRVIKLLREKGVNPCLKNKQGKTPLHLALESNDLLLAKELFHVLEVEGYQDPEGYTLLHRAVLDKDTSFLKQLAELGINKKLKDAQGNTPLHLAVEQGDLDMVEQLTKLGAEVHVSNNKGLYPVHLAIVKRKTSIAQKLIGHTHINVTDNKERKTPLVWAIDTENLELIKDFTQAGANLHYTNGDGLTPIDIASVSKHLEYVEQIFAVSNSQLNTLGGDGLGHLHRAIKRKDLQLAKQLLAIQSIDINLKDKGGRTPLHIAVEQGDILMVKYLKEAKASKDARDNNNKTPIYLALQNTNQVLAKQLFSALGVDMHAQDLEGYTLLHRAVLDNDITSFKQLVAWGGDTNVKDKNVDTPLHLAVRKSTVEFLTQLIAVVKDKDAKGLNGATPLHVAAACGNESICKLLVGAGASIEGTDGYDNTPLHQAVYYGQETTAKLLIALGANKNAKNKKGNTPLHTAIQEGKLTLATHLLEKGGDLHIKNEEGLTPIDIASLNDRLEYVTQLASTKHINIQATSSDGTTHLHRATERGDLKLLKQLIKSGADKGSLDAAKNTILHLAIAKGHVELVKYLMEQGADLQVKNAAGLTPIDIASTSNHLDYIAYLLPSHQISEINILPHLHQAIARGDLNLFKELFNFGASKKLQDLSGNTLLHTAIGQGQLAIVKYLVEGGADLQAKNKAALTPIDLASASNHLDCLVTIFAIQGVDINERGIDGITHLHRAVERGDERLVQKLIACQADAAVADDKGATPLHHAARKGNTILLKHLQGGIKSTKFWIKLFYQQGGVVDILDLQGNTPMHVAMGQGHLAATQFLLQAQANPYAKNLAGLTPIHLALAAKQYELLKALLTVPSGSPLQVAADHHDIPLIKQLLALGIDIDTADSTGKTILYIAFKKRDSELTKQLIELGAKINAADSQGRTILHHAITHQDALVATALLAAKADIQGADQAGLTPLHLAAQYGLIPIGRQLINLGAVVNVKDKQKRTPLHLAAHQGHGELAQLLIDAGADLEAIDEQGITPLEEALQQGELGLVELIADAQEAQLHTWRQKYKTNHQSIKTGYQGEKTIENPSKVAANWIENYIVQLPEKEQAPFKTSIVPLVEKKLFQASIEEQLSLIKYWENRGSFYPAVLEGYSVSDWIGESLVIDISQEALIGQDEVLFSKFQKQLHTTTEHYQAKEKEQLLLKIREKQLTYELDLLTILEVLTYLTPFKAEQALSFLEVADPYWLASLQLAWLQEQTKSLAHFKPSQRKQLSYVSRLLLGKPALVERFIAGLRAEKDFNQIKRFVAFISQHKVAGNTLLTAFYKIPLEATASKVQAWQHYIACELLKGKLVKLFPTHATKLEKQAYLLLRQGVDYEDIVTTLDSLSALLEKALVADSLVYDLDLILEKALLSLENLVDDSNLSLEKGLVAQSLVDAWELLTAYGASVTTCQKALQVIQTRPTHEWEKEVHALVIHATFGAAHERTVEELVAYVATKSPESHFISDPKALRKSYEAVLTAYEDGSQLFPANKTHIACWKESDIAAWAKHVKGSKLLQAMSPATQHEVVAVVKRAAELHHGHAPRATQLLALLLYLNHAPGKGRLGQINTGEGKSLIVAMLAGILALQGKKVDVVTTSTELSRPEVEKQQGFFKLLELSVGENSDKDTKQEAYKQDIVYGTAGNFQGDILRSEFLGKDVRGNRGFGVVIVDEVDSMLFDSRRASVRIAGQTPAMHHLELLLGSVYSQVHRMKDHIIEQDGEAYYIHEDFQIQEGQITTFSGEPLHMEPVKDKKAYIIGLTKKYVERLLRTLSSEEAREWQAYQRLQEAIISKGIEISQTEDEKTREQLEKGCRALQDQLKNTEWVKKDRFPVVEVPTHLRDFALQQITNWIESAIQAIYFFKRELHYDVREGRIVPIDYENTGVLQANMVWSNGLAQMLQIKEGLLVEPEGIATNFLSVPAYFERYGHSLYGLTGTLGNEATKQFLKEVYQADQFVLPPYQLLPIAGNEHSNYVCKELPAIVVPNSSEWYEAIVKTNLQQAKNKRAVLIICKYIDQVKQVAQLFKEQYDEHKVLTYTGQENFTKKHIEAGEIIVATNIAGRGTDITTLLEVEANGGLHVCITFLPESYRVELQNVGRTARQGKRGTAQLILQETKSIEVLKSERDAQEEQAITRAKNDVKNMLFKDRMFSRFCALESDLLPTHQENSQKNIYLLLKKHISVSKQEDQAFQDILSKKGSLAREYNWGQEEREGLEERWGIWLHHGLEDKTDTVQGSIQKNFDTFATTIRQDATRNLLIKNPYYHVKKGNNLLRYQRLDEAIAAYNQAIDLDELHSVNARYNKALALLSYQKNKDHLADAKYNLERAKILLATHNKPQVIGFHATVAQTGNKPQLLDNIQHQIDILIKQESYIDAALKEIAKAQKEDWDIQVTDLKTLQDVFQEDTTGANRGPALEKATINGLSHMFVLKAKQPYPWKSIIALACLGIAQVAVGVLAFVYSGGTTGLGLINEGVSDLIAGVKAGISGTFSWAQWGIQKAISIAVSLVASGIKSIKDTISNGMKVVQETVKDGLKDALKHTAVALGKGVAKELTTAALSHVSEKVIIENLEGWIESEVTKKLETLFSQNELIKKALSIDVANKSNHWQQILISEGMAILAKTDGKFMQFLKGTACGLIRQGVSEIGNHISSQGGSGQAFQLMFQGTTMLHALTEILSMTEDFASEWNKELALKYGKEIDKAFEKGEQKQKKEQAKEDKAPEVKTKNDLILSVTATPALEGEIAAIQVSKNTTYTSKPGETGSKARDYYYGGASTQQDLSKNFASQIQGKITKKVQADLIHPVVSGVASWGIEKLSKELTDDVNKALEGFRTQNRTHHIGKQFTKAEKDEKQEGQTTAKELNRESQQKIKDILEGKPSTIDDVPLLSKAIKRPIVIYKNGKVFDTIGSEFPGEPLHISHTPEGVGHWAPYDTSIKVEASGKNNCLQDTAMVLLGTKACQEIGIKTAAELRNLEVKEITDNPALANELMKEAAKLSILKPTAMMQGGREYNIDVKTSNGINAITKVGDKGGEKTQYYYEGYFEEVESKDGKIEKKFKPLRTVVLDGISLNLFPVLSTKYSTTCLMHIPQAENSFNGVMHFPKGPASNKEGSNSIMEPGRYGLTTHILPGSKYNGELKFFRENPVLGNLLYKGQGRLLHTGNNFKDTTGCGLPARSLIKNHTFTVNETVLDENGKTVEEAVTYTDTYVLNSEATKEALKETVKSFGENANGDFNLALVRVPTLEEQEAQKKASTKEN